jgi:hypothetical protein
MAQRFRAIDLSRVEEIQPYCGPPWGSGIIVTIDEREGATEHAIASTAAPDIEPVFTDGSVRNDLVGFTMVTAHFAYNQTIGTSLDLNVYFAELFAIYQAIESIERYVQDQRIPHLQTIRHLFR